MTPRESLVRNEQAKLSATYLNGLAIALGAVGGIAPWIAAVQTGTGGLVSVSLGLACLLLSAGLHLVARSRLKALVA